MQVRVMLGRSLSLLKYQGPRWLAYRGIYAVKRRVGWFQRQLACGQWQADPTGSLVEMSLLGDGYDRSVLGSDEAICKAEDVLGGSLSFFSHHTIQGKFPPDWFSNPWGRGSGQPDMRHWSAIDDFTSGDIKGVWEQGRFGFVYPLVRAGVHLDDPRFAEAFWQAVEDFRTKNPPQCGPHWKCGQEIALRLMTWAFGIINFRCSTATTLEREAMLAEMITTAAQRIELNIDYALSQKNNHGVSEAAGLFTAGILLGQLQWIEKGQRLLDRLAQELIYYDGSFSQHSTNYHRLMLHVYLWCIRLGEAARCPFSNRTIDRVRQAGRWLLSMMAPNTGHVPNLGPNDGALLFDLTDCGYRDYRPIVQAIGLATDKQRWLPHGPWDELAAWMGCLTDLSESPKPAEPDCELRLQSFPDGGYVVWSDGRTLALLRGVPSFRHRPSHCDLLHFDLWVSGRNLLRDAGTYSYNCEEPWQSFFASSRAHNTIQFDGRDPMPKLSRFLYGAWPQGKLEVGEKRVTAGYGDYRGAEHSRSVMRTPGGFRIEDRIGGKFQAALLRWRLDPELEWTLTKNGCRSAELNLAVQTNGKPTAPRIVTCWESRFYWQKNELPVLEVEVGAECQELVTEIEISP